MFGSEACFWAPEWVKRRVRALALAQELISRVELA